MALMAVYLASELGLYELGLRLQFAYRCPHTSCIYSEPLISVCMNSSTTSLEHSVGALAERIHQKTVHLPTSDIVRLTSHTRYAFRLSI